MIAEPDPKIDMLHIQVIPEDSAITNDGSWKRTSIFNTIVTCRGRFCLLYIDNDGVINGISQELVDQLKLPTEPIDKPYQVTWIDGSKMIVS